MLAALHENPFSFFADRGDECFEVPRDRFEPFSCVFGDGWNVAREFGVLTGFFEGEEV
jgi:hypothetical protein